MIGANETPQLEQRENNNHGEQSKEAKQETYR
jgi:hypothetical protein